MSDKVQEAALEAGTAATDAVILDGLTKIAQEVATNRKKADEAVKSIKDETVKAVETLEGKVNRSLEDIVGRINKLKDYSGVLGRAMLNITPGEDNLKEVVSPTVKAMAGAFESVSKSMPKDSAFADPLVHMATHEFFVSSTRSQLRRYAANASDHAQKTAKIYAALQEKYYGSEWEALTKASLQEGDPLEGGNLVPTIVEADIIRQVKDAGKLFPLARQFQMTKKTHDVPAESGAVSVNWVAEEGTLTAGEPTIRKKTLTALKVAGRATMSIELVEDSNVGLLAYLLEVFTEKMAGELDKQLVCGDGSSPAITGIDNTTGINVIASSGTTAGRALTYAHLVSTYTGSGEGASIENGVWVVSPKGYTQILALADTSGQPIVKLGTVETAPAGTIFGRPVILSARFGGTPSGVAATLDDSTNANTRILYGVPRSLLFGTRTGFRWDVTDQVNWATYQMDARLIGRFGMIVGIPGNWSRITKINY